VGVQHQELAPNLPRLYQHRQSKCRSTFLSFHLSFAHRNTLFPSCQATMSDGQPTSKSLASSLSHLVPSALKISINHLHSPLFPPLHYAVYHSTVFSILSVVRVDVLFIIHVYNATLPLPLFTSLVPGLISPASRSYYTTRKISSSDLSMLADLIFLLFLTFSLFCLPLLPIGIVSSSP